MTDSNEEDRTRRLLELLYHVSREVATALDLRTVLQRVLYEAIQNVGGERCSVVVLDDSNKAIDATIVYGKQVHEHTTQQMRDTMERGLAGWVIRNRKGVYIPDTSNDDRWLRRPDDEQERSPVKSAICVPLQAREKLVGVLTLVHPTPNAFSSEQLDLMQAIADQAFVDPERDQPGRFFDTQVFEPHIGDTRGVTMIHAQRPLASLVMNDVAVCEQHIVDVFPEFAPPKVEIQNLSTGLSASAVEELVTVPLEQALYGFPGLDVMRSRSVPDLSDIVLIFKPGTDLMLARPLVNERLHAVYPTLPTWAAPPVIIQPLSSTSRAMKIGISSDQYDLKELSMIAYWKIRGVRHVHVQEIGERADP